MADMGLSSSQLEELIDCLSNKHTGLCISYASAALFLFDFSLTFANEIKFIWRPRRISLGSLLFMLARYPAFASTVITLLPTAQSTKLRIVNTVFRLITIAASEFILVVRTWAIWGKRRSILYLLVILTIVVAVPWTVIMAKDIAFSQSSSPIAPQLVGTAFDCSTAVNLIKDVYVLPYILAIGYESVTLSLSLIQIVRWHRRFPKNIRSSLLNNLWKDELLYFSWMLGLGFTNIALAVQLSSSQLRTGGAQLQTSLHSILATRVVLHLSGSGPPSRNIDRPGLLATPESGIQFTTVMMTTEDFEIESSPETDETLEKQEA